MPRSCKWSFALLSLLVLLAAGAYFRSSGLFRGLDRNIIYHPDSPKQVMMLYNFLHGNYLQHYDSLFYDGYPYGLNRVDEWIIRSTLLPLRPLRTWLNPEHYHDWTPSRGDLYYWGRILRVLYGLITVLLIYAAIRKWGGHHGPALAAASLYALAPLGATVSHSVTGDIGVDLFLGLAIWSLAGYAADNRRRWLWLYGLACGMAFSCKYQGALGIWMAAVTVALVICRDWKLAGHTIRRGLVIFVAFILGVIAGTPALLVDPEKAWRYMRKNFAFLKDYGVSREFLDQPFLTKVTHGLSHNTPVVLDSIGWMFVLLALLALITSLVVFIKFRNQPETLRRNAVFVGIASFPFMALFLSIALKPAVQPFHFTFTLPAMATACGLMFHYLSGTRHPGYRWIAGVVFLFAVTESIRTNLREDFFWRRAEISGLANDFSEAIFERQSYATKDHAGRRIIKQLYVEPSTLPVFRNRPSGLQHDESAWWQQQHQLPVPSIPLPVMQEWLFINGPVFPRSDRMFAVPASGPGMVGRTDDNLHVSRQPLMIVTDRERGTWIERTLVYHQQPESIKLGLRTGRWPSRLDIVTRGFSRRLFIPPHSQRTVTIDDAAARVYFRGQYKNPDTFLYPICIRSQLGPTWITVLNDPREETIFNMYGPDPSDITLPHLPRLSAPELERKLENLKYLQSTGSFDVPVEKIRLPGDAAPLAAGHYRLTARLLNTGETQRVFLELKDLSGLSRSDIRMEQDIPPGIHQVDWRFQKEFAPYDATIFISASSNQLVMLNWQLKPDPRGLEQRVQPAAAPDVIHPEQNHLNVVFPGIGTVRGIAIPSLVSAATTFPYMVRFDLDENIKHKTFHEAVIFLHLKDHAGQIVAALDLPLSKASMSGESINWQYLASGIAPGSYHLDGGIYNARTRLRYPFENPEPIIADLKRDFFRWAELTVRNHSDH